MISKKYFKSLDKIRKERRRIPKENEFKENKKIPLLSSNKSNNITLYNQFYIVKI